MARRKLQAVSPAGGDAPARARQAGQEQANLTIEQLARETGMTVRNIRNHQSSGLLPPPEVRLRVGYYGPDHVARLRLIQEMQADGFNLRAIKRLLGGTHDAAAQILGLKRAVSAGFEAEPPEILTEEELLERFGPVGPKELARAQKLELVTPLGGGRYEVLSPPLLRAAEEVMRRGVPLAAALTAVERLRRHSAAASRTFVELFLEEVWKPVEQSDEFEERWPEVVESIEHLRPLASEALLAVFQLTMTREIEDAFAKELERRAKRAH